MTKVLLVGSGGREHALGWRLAQDPGVSAVYYAPGNAGTRQEWKSRTVPIDASKKSNFPALFDVIKNEHIDLAVVGPEAPLVEGLVDYLYAHGYDRVFGPTRLAARLEYDKFFSYKLMDKLKIPQAYSIICHSVAEARSAIQEHPSLEGIVLKARGLTDGKGVTVCDSKEHALALLPKHVKNFGEELLIAERLHGQEFSVFGIADSKRVSPIEVSFQDHKTIYDDDEGPNTGGMGAYGPAPIAPVEVVRHVADSMMTPIVHHLRALYGVEYKGFMYGNLMMTKEGPKVLEWNCRFGDPECQPAMMLLEGNFYEALVAGLEGKLDAISLRIQPGAACCVVMASPGYPGPYVTGSPINDIYLIDLFKDIKVFHAGTRIDAYGQIVTAGGRVLGVTAYSLEGIKDARELAYMGVSLVQAEGGLHYRKDIALKALK